MPLNKVHKMNIMTLRNLAFENKAGCSLSLDSSNLPLGSTMCSSEHIGCGEKAAATESSILYKNGTLMWELAFICWIAIYYL